VKSKNTPAVPSGLYATVCSIDPDGLLHLFGDPHHYLPGDRWTFDGWALHYELEIPTKLGTFDLVAALGHAPNEYDVGCVDLGRHKFRFLDRLTVRLSLNLNCQQRDVTVHRDYRELEACRELPAGPVTTALQ
jgi:hypothetical protein